LYDRKKPHGVDCDITNQGVYILNSMAKVNQLAGVYNVTGRKLTKADLNGSLQVLQRKTVTPSRPVNYIVAKTPDNPRGEYISSLYPTPDPLTWRLESGGQWYTLTHTSPDTIAIVPVYINGTFVSIMDTDQSGGGKSE
jgi:hypothetical protein